MLKQLHIQNFTVFSDAVFKFSPGINVVIGSNGAGKSHLLKIAYAVARTSYNQRNGQVSQSKAVWQKAIADDLVSIFRPESLGRLARRQQGHSKAEIAVKFETVKDAGFGFSFSTRSTTEVQLTGAVPTGFAPAAPVFIPTKELLSLFPGLLSLYNEYQLSLDETYPDLCERLGKPLLRGARVQEIAPFITTLEAMAGGEIKIEHGRFYLYQNEGARLEIDLLAEGLRKLATIAYLLKNGSLTTTTTLFWDEPEANLNPRLIKQLARLLYDLSNKGYQIIMATHSLFLLKEFHILSREKDAAIIRYFGLTGEKGIATEVAAVNNLDELPHIAALEAELEQSDRFQEAIID